MKITIKEKENEIVLDILGNIESGSASDLESTLSGVIDKRKNVILNFAKVSYCSSAGLRVLLSAQKRLMEMKKLLSIINANSVVKEVFDITGFASFLEVK